MSISFIVESQRMGPEEEAVKLFKHVSSEDVVQIPQTIALLGDDLDESGCFRGDWHKSVCVHLIGNLLSVPDNAESLVAWYATVGLASFVLQASLKGNEIWNAVRLGGSMEVTAVSILEALGAVKYDVGSRFLTLSNSAVECFLLGRLHKKPSAISSVRQRIKGKTTFYLEHELGFDPSVIKVVENEIDLIDGPFLKEHESWVAGNPNVFWHSWCNYFRNLDASDLSLFRP